ncbi:MULTISPECIES: 50S ribosomal protein L11 methyltransferase [Rhodomicrobium]|uniref:50S ribosomal protein L11 methyltransferase n=1 Tax=Rhodomicrobium TaxID=1068 RepID=UPI000B4BFD5A|nr:MULTISPECIES: 50S ribosomal protein L11 methyltransferase [Rhodomicrobium]
MPTYKASILGSAADVEVLTGLFTEMLDPPPAISAAETPEGWLLEVYFVEPPSPAELGAVADSVPHFAAIRDIELETIPDEDWVERTQRGLHPIEAGRFFVHGSHDRGRAEGRAYAIEIDAGQAFGTAHHGTTRGCLLLIDRLAKKQGIWRMLDLGTGSGVLSIAAAKSLCGDIVASDIDPVAIAVAKENFARNGVSAEITPVVAAGLDDRAIAEKAPYDLVTANILAGPLLALAPALAKVMGPGGHLILSGLLDSQAREVRARYLAQGFVLAASLSLEGWTALHLRRNGRGV